MSPTSSSATSISPGPADLPVVVVGAGPIGLAAAAHLRSRGVAHLVLEAGEGPGAAVAEWGHVRLFSPWRELVDPVARELLLEQGWEPPHPDRYPTGARWVDDYLRPLAEVLAPAVRYGTRVTAVARHGRDRLVSSGRDRSAFTLHLRTSAGTEHLAARAVVDATGTWGTPNPLGGDGVVALGERESADRIGYRVPDLDQAVQRSRFAGRHVVVAGTGASAKGALLALTALAESEPGTTITWLVRRSRVGAAFAGSGQDELPQRGALGQLARAAVDRGPVTTRTGFRTAEVRRRDDDRLDLVSFDGQVVEGVDEVLALTGFRPDLGWTDELRLDLDPVLQAPRALAPLIDPNEHSCGTVYPHGVAELAQPEVGYYPVGMKSYGRATSFLALTGFEQTRSVAAALAGDHEAAARVELTLPDTGVCGGAGTFDDETATDGGCCGAPAVEVLSIGGVGTR
ncbi:NAD(P)-binding domain-containing protein [Aeromicrobium sp. Leaf245]|uniref:NAD(P)-binding domain-containing protein n=1 Tax=Aeromicrobium sp. Leaf245 TaxID=1736306 RepID=UPI0006FEC8A9|nr:NAD(P)-binding domain-containing protein [Aeromicrobium sp. Leaf245]KQO36507.1 flavoprotein [Aeromicrobium sp. Leaf245]